MENSYTQGQLAKIINLLTKIVGLMEPKEIDFRTSEDIKTEDRDLPTITAGLLSAKSTPGVEGTIDQKHPDSKSHFLEGVCPRCRSNKLDTDFISETIPGSPGEKRRKRSTTTCPACGWEVQVEESF